MEIILILTFSGIVLILFFLIVRRKELSSQQLLEQFRDITQINSQVRIILEEQGNLRSLVNRLSAQVLEIEARIKENSFSIKEDLVRDLHQAQKAIENLRVEYQERKKVEEEIQAISRDIYQTLIGARKRGISGENILRESFSNFPRDLIEYDFKVGGKVVEYALVLPNKKRIPIDSKWPAQDLLEKWHKEEDPSLKERIFSEIERRVLNKVKEAGGYIDPSSTINQAIVPLPDSIFSLLRKAHIEAQKENVVLIPYSLSLPYILAIYSFYLRNLKSVNLEDLDNYLSKIEKDINTLKMILENSISRAVTMIKNAYDESRNILGKMEADLTLLRRYSPQNTSEDENRCSGR